MSQPLHFSLTDRVALTGTAAPARKIDAIKEVRRIANLELGPAKEIVDAVLGGARRAIPLVTETNATAVAHRFAALGFLVEVDGRRITSPEAYQPTWSRDQRGTVDVQALYDHSESGRLSIEARLVSGRVASGDRLGLPLNGSTVVVAPIEQVVTRDEGLLLIEAEADAEAVEFWTAMNVIGETLPVLA